MDYVFSGCSLFCFDIFSIIFCRNERSFLLVVTRWRLL